MAKHVCGSCHFFQTSKERDKLGWCTNPERQDSSDVRILVRAGELRCRNDWGSDLWREKGSVDRVLEVVMHEGLGASRGAPSDKTDQLVAAARPLMATIPLVAVGNSAAEDSPESEARRVSTELNSELVRRARQQYRDRQQTKGYVVDAPASPLEREALVVSNDYVPPSGHEIRPESPLRFADRESHAAAFHQVPDQETNSEVLFRSQTQLRPMELTDASDNIVSRHLTDPEDDLTRGAPQSPGAETDGGHPFADLSEGGAERSDASPAAAGARQDWWLDVEAVIVGDGESRAAISDEDSFESWSDATQDGEPPVLPYGLWSDIPISCQTCRDFRPAGDGARGWCNSKWAFKHRRMVDADDCPCETSIGHWWLPADGAWQSEFDVAALGQPTPLMDKYFGRPEIALDESFGERRRRRS